MGNELEVIESMELFIAIEKYKGYLPELRFLLGTPRVHIKNKSMSDGIKGSGPAVKSRSFFI